jgi:histidinol dehydrogenase
MAKRKVYGIVDINSVAGPSEVLIIANESANPAWVAADMLSQVEHGTDSSAIVVTDSEVLARAVLEELDKQLDQLSRADEARESLKKFSGIIVVNDMDEAVKLAFASEHLEIQCGSKSREISDRISNAGAIFIGPYSPVAVGDYFAGPSHTLPTGRCARFSSAVTSNDFVKSISLIEYDNKKLAQSAADIIRMAEVEGLDAHANSVKLRQDK